MLWRDEITLITVTAGKNAYGEPTETTATKTVRADKQSVRQSEFYQAATAGYKPELVFVIRACEYAGQPQVTYNSKTYDVIRTYTKDDETIELVCGKGVR